MSKYLYLRIAAVFLLLWQTLLFADGLVKEPAQNANLSEAQPFWAITGENVRHKIEEGESLFRIARMYGASYTAVARASGIKNPNMIFAGKILLIPLRSIVPGKLDRGLLINIPEFRLFVFKDGAVTGVYPVCIGLPTWQTPLGEFSVANKVKDPAWYMPPDMAEKEKIKREIIPAGPNNPVGDRWIGTSKEHTGIHGTNSPMSIGRALSHGCIRLYPESILKVFDEVDVGDPAVFVYEPIKIIDTGEEILVEIHPDVYSLIPDLCQHAKKRLEELNLLDRICPEKLEKAIGQISGVPVPIGK